jgi:predicted DNA-binding transcriptional regulator AlpA
VWAAAFRDRIVHHLLYRRVAPAIEARFIADSCACIPDFPHCHRIGQGDKGRRWKASDVIEWAESR